MNEEQINKIEEMKGRVQGQNQGIYFSRVPEKEWRWFREYTEKEWCNDYGLAFSAIIKGIVPPDMEIATILEEHEERIKKLEAQIYYLQSTQKEKKTISTGSGKIINKRTGEKQDE